MTENGRSGAEQLCVFLELSAALTGHERVVLEGTGLAPAYLDQLERVLGPTLADALLRRAGELLARGLSGAELETALRDELLSDARLGPLARALLKLWYTGSWYQLPAGWRGTFGATTPDFDPEGLDVDRVVSAESYKEGLVWPTIGAHPMGAKQPGYGTWAFPPRQTSEAGDAR